MASHPIQTHTLDPRYLLYVILIKMHNNIVHIMFGVSLVTYLLILESVQVTCDVYNCYYRAAFVLMLYVCFHVVDACAEGACGSEPDCSQPGVTYLPGNTCDTFFQCNNGEAVPKDCGPGTIWDQDVLVCVTGSC